MNKLRALLFSTLLLAAPLAGAATVTHAVNTADTGPTPNTSGAFTPASGDLLVVWAHCPGTLLDTAQLTSSIGGFTFTQVATAVRSTNARVYLFVSDALVSSATSQTVDFAVSGDECTGSVITVERVAGMSRDGTDAIRQTAKQDDGSSGTPPAPTFASSALTGNVTVGAVLQNGLTTITEPTNWTESADQQLDDTADSTLESVFRNSGFTGTTITWGSNASSTTAVLIAELDTSAAGVAANFTSGPTVAAAANGYTISGTLNGTGFGSLVAYAVGVSPGDGAPTCTQIKAGQNDGGSSALLAANETWTTDVADSFALAAANNIPSMDVHVCGSDGTNDTSVTSSADQLRSARSGFALVTMASHSATGLCNLDSYFTPDCADGDVFEYEDDTNESADCNVAIAVDGEVTLTPVAPGDCDGRQTFEISYEDVSSATTGLFSAPTVGTFATDDTVYINNSAPVCEINPADANMLLVEDAAMEALDFTAYCSDADADALTFSVTSGTLPNGTSLSGTGNKDWSGTPDTEDEAGAAITITATDVAGDTDTVDFTVYVVNQWAAPNCVTNTPSECEAEIITAAPWREFDAGLVIDGTECSEATPGTITSQDPAAAGATDPFEDIHVMLAVACGDPATERKIVFVLSDLTGLTRWVDYIPVGEVPGCDAGRYEENGCWAVQALSSTTGKVAWVDYIPVGEVSEDELGKWRYENNGWIPVDDLTP